MDRVRETLNDETFNRWVKEHCVAVPYYGSWAKKDASESRKFISDLYERYKSVLPDGFPGGNNFGFITPTGKWLGQDPKEALEKWRALPEGDRKPAVETLAHRPAQDAPLPALSPGTLNLRYYIRPLHRGAGGKLEIYSDSVKPKIDVWFPWWNWPQPDHFRMSPEEWKELVPSRIEKGLTYDVPEGIRQRIYRCNTPVRVDGDGPRWRWDRMKHKEMTLTVDEVKGVKVELLLEGRFQAWAHGESEAKAYYKLDGRALGRATYDSSKKAFTRFDLALLADVETGYTRYVNGCNNNGDRPGRNPFGWVFGLVPDESWIDLAPGGREPYVNLRAEGVE